MARIPSVVDLTIEQKVALTSGKDRWHIGGIIEADIPAYIITDGPYGLRKMLHDGGETNESVPATCFPPAAGMVHGLQAKGIGAALKHFAANNQETDRLRIDARISDRAMREIYLPAFEYIVKTAKPWAIMCSYNRINNVYSSENHWLLTDVLRKQ